MAASLQYNAIKNAGWRPRSTQRKVAGMNRGNRQTANNAHALNGSKNVENVGGFISVKE
jgi:hypothetical protein